MKRGDLLLVPFPFSDQSGRKVRPVIVISNDEFNVNSEDLIVVGVTSNLSKDRYTLNLPNEELEEGNLIAKCCVKCESILKIDKEIIIKKIGKISKEKLEKIRKLIIEIIS